jgi:hypothetical protein
VQKLGIVKAIATTAGKAIPKSRLQWYSSQTRLQPMGIHTTTI